MKKGVSSLVATVILISFGITLAIFVINWGTDFLRSSQEDVTKQSQEKFSCTNDVAFEAGCKCTEDEIHNLNTCTLKITNNKDSTINSISYRMFRGGGLVITGTESDLTDWTKLGIWEVSNYYIIPNLPASTPSDNVKLEILATQIEKGGNTINCGSLAKDTANCIIE